MRVSSSLRVVTSLLVVVVDMERNALFGMIQCSMQLAAMKGRARQLWGLLRTRSGSKYHLAGDVNNPSGQTPAFLSAWILSILGSEKRLQFLQLCAPVSSAESSR